MVCTCKQVENSSFSGSAWGVTGKFDCTWFQSDLKCCFVQLMRDLPNLNEKNKEKPLCFPYSVKARALIHSHLTRLKLPPNSLELGKWFPPAVTRQIFYVVLCISTLIKCVVISRCKEIFTDGHLNMGQKGPML